MNSIFLIANWRWKLTSREFRVFLYLYLIWSKLLLSKQTLNNSTLIESMTLKFFWFTLIDKTFNCLVYWLCEFYLFALRIGELSVQTKYRNSNARVCYPTSTGQPPPLSLQSLVKSNNIHFVSISPFNPILHDRKWSNNNDLTYIRLSNLREYPQSEDWTEMRERPRDHHINLIFFFSAVSLPCGGGSNAFENALSALDISSSRCNGSPCGRCEDDEKRISSPYM